MEEYDDWDEDEETPLGWYCLSCGHIQTDHMGLHCDRCYGPLDEYYG